MKIELFKSLEGVIEHYGDIPESHNLPESQVESKRYAMPNNLSLLSDFAMEMNSACGTLLDISDIDFLNATQCKKLVSFVEAYGQTSGAQAMPKQFLSDLAMFAKKAIELDTGIVVEL